MTAIFRVADSCDLEAEHRDTSLFEALAAPGTFDAEVATRDLDRLTLLRASTEEDRAEQCLHLDAAEHGGRPRPLSDEEALKLQRAGRHQARERDEVAEREGSIWHDRHPEDRAGEPERRLVCGLRHGWAPSFSCRSERRWLGDGVFISPAASMAALASPAPNQAARGLLPSSRPSTMRAGGWGWRGVSAMSAGRVRLLIKGF